MSGCLRMKVRAVAMWPVTNFDKARKVVRR